MAKVCFWYIKSFSYGNLKAKHHHFRCSRPPVVDGIKTFDKSNLVIKHKTKRTTFCGLIIFIKNSDPINIRSPWVPETMFQWGHHDQNFLTYQKQEVLATHFNFTSFQQGPFSTWPLLFTSGVFWLRFNVFFRKLF